MKKEINTDTSLEEQLSELSPKWQQIFAWFIENFDNVVKMCEDSKLTKQEVTFLRQQAIENDDTVLEFLMILKGILDSNKA